jgi:hypothetical protein
LTKKCLITGPLFKEFLLSEREKTKGDADIQAVWLITPIEVINESRKVRKEGEMNKDPLYNVYLDRLRIVSTTDNKKKEELCQKFHEKKEKL